MSAVKSSITGPGSAVPRGADRSKGTTSLAIRSPARRSPRGCAGARSGTRTGTHPHRSSLWYPLALRVEADRSYPDRWRAAAAAWERFDYLFEPAYARFREAEALLADRASRSQVEQVLRSAHRTAAALGAGPLRRELELLAQRGRVRLEVPTQPPPAKAEAPAAAISLGLTPREEEVLALVATGRTNRQIGQELFITEKTASVHVSRILAKLGVAGRGEAAAIAHRLGLDPH